MGELDGMGNVERDWPLKPPEYIDMCATCGYTAWREHYPCNRCGGLESVRFVPQPRGAVDALAEAVRAHTRAIHALAGNCDYPEDERYATGERLAGLLSDLKGGQ